MEPGSSKLKGLVPLNDADLDHVSGGWGPGFGVYTATEFGGNVPPGVYTITSSLGVAAGKLTDPLPVKPL